MSDGHARERDKLAAERNALLVSIALKDQRIAELERQVERLLVLLGHEDAAKLSADHERLQEENTRLRAAAASYAISNKQIREAGK